MNINTGNIFDGMNQRNSIINEQQNSATSQITSQAEVENISDLRLLLPGDVFRAQILDIRNSDVSILLSDGSKVQAAMPEALSLNIGDQLLFQVKSSNDNEIVIKPFQNVPISHERIENTLLSLGLTINDKNVAVVQELIANGEPIDKKSIISLLRHMNTYPTQDIDKLILMNKNGIEINDENLKQFDQYMNSSHKLIDGINSIAKNISEYIKEALTEGVSQENSNVNLNHVSNVLEHIENIFEEKILYDNLENEKIYHSNKDVETEIKDNQKGFIQSDNNQNINLSQTKGNFKQDTIYDKLSESIKSYNEAIKDISKSPKDELKSLQNSIIRILNENPTIHSINQVIHVLSDNNMKEQLLQNILNSGHIEKIIRNSVNQKLKISVEMLNGENAPKEFAKELDKVYKMLEKLTQMSSEFSGEQSKMTQSLAQNLSSMNENLSFMNALNHMNSYIQLPLHLSSGDGNGDLYIYNNKKRKSMNQSDSLTAFLHLDLEHLGATDISISLKNKNITTQFSMQDEISCKLVEKHIDLLKSRLEELGYVVNCKIEKKKSQENDDNNIFLNVMQDTQKKQSIKRYTLDIRT